MDNHNNISYDDNWKFASEPVRIEKREERVAEKAPEHKKKTKIGRPVLTLLQIILCLLIVLSAYILKLFGGDLYKNIKQAYETELNNEIILNPYENSLDKLINVSED